MLNNIKITDSEICMIVLKDTATGSAVSNITINGLTLKNVTQTGHCSLLSVLSLTGTLFASQEVHVNQLDLLHSNLGGIFDSPRIFVDNLYVELSDLRTLASQTYPDIFQVTNSEFFKLSTPLMWKSGAIMTGVTKVKNLKVFDTYVDKLIYTRKTRKSVKATPTVISEISIDTSNISEMISADILIVDNVKISNSIRYADALKFDFDLHGNSVTSCSILELVNFQMF